MRSRVRSTPVIEKLKEFGFEKISLTEVSSKYHYSIQDWIDLILWPMGAGTGELTGDVCEYIGNELLKELNKKAFGKGIFETYEHFVFKGFKA